MKLYRCFAWNRDTRDGTDSPLWFPRIFQGEGRHDNPEVYGCLYLADRPLSCIVEQLAPFRGQRLAASMLRRRGLPLALAEIEIEHNATLIDFDDPVVLGREGLRPSRVATRNRSITQPQALDLYRRYPQLAGLQWWSSWEAMWMNVTVFDRAAMILRLISARVITLDDPLLQDAADRFGLRAT